MADARKGKGEGKIGYVRNSRHRRPVLRHAHARFQFSFWLPVSSACHAGHLNRVPAEIVFANIAVHNVGSNPLDPSLT